MVADGLSLAPSQEAGVSLPAYRSSEELVVRQRSRFRAPSMASWPSRVLLGLAMVTAVVFPGRSFGQGPPSRAPRAGDPPAQTRSSAADDERERAFVDALRGQDPAAAENYVRLRDARSEAIAKLKEAEAQYAAAGVELRPVVLPRLKHARARYAESSLALLDFFDARDQRALANYQSEIGRINVALEERKRARAEFEKLLRGE